MKLIVWFRLFWATLFTAAKPAEPAKPLDRPLSPGEMKALIRSYTGRDLEYTAAQDSARERLIEFEEARAMSGAGPWLPDNRVPPSPLASVAVRARESVPAAMGSTADLELQLQNFEWRREINYSLMEFSRWGIQQIILIARLYYIKNPIIRRLLNVDAYYVFGRGVEVSSDNEAVNTAIHEFLELNKAELGQTALSEHQKRTNYDGNLFFAMFPDTAGGPVRVRSFDATEIQEIVTNPNDALEPWYYKRTWTAKEFDTATGAIATKVNKAWYPAIKYQPAAKPETIGGDRVMWDIPVYHRKYGAVGKWLFGCPVIYPALDWAKAARRYLEACATLASSLAQFSMKAETKGGQQALQGFKQQLSTTVGPGTSGYDQNPTATNGSMFISGPGTKLEAFNSRAQALDPNEYKPFAAMAAICMDIPPTFLGDLETANLATATSLDRPTELAFIHKQEAWREVLADLVTYALDIQLRAPDGKLREAITALKLAAEVSQVRIAEAPRRNMFHVKHAPGKTFSVYMNEAERKAAGKIKEPATLEIRVNFPAIVQGDIPEQVTATVQAMTLGDSSGTVHGIDEKEGNRRLMDLLGFENADELIEEMYPDGVYDPERKSAPEPADPAAVPANTANSKTAIEARLRDVAKRLEKLTEAA
jgi:hypothetical protein